MHRKSMALSRRLFFYIHGPISHSEGTYSNEYFCEGNGPLEFSAYEEIRTFFSTITHPFYSNMRVVADHLLLEIEQFIVEIFLHMVEQNFHGDHKTQVIKCIPQVLQAQVSPHSSKILEVETKTSQHNQLELPSILGDLSKL